MYLSNMKTEEASAYLLSIRVTHISSNQDLGFIIVSMVEMSLPAAVK